MVNSNPFFIALNNKTKMANMNYQLKDTALEDDSLESMQIFFFQPDGNCSWYF
jgi:hypothetical protein